MLLPKYLKKILLVLYHNTFVFFKNKILIFFNHNTRPNWQAIGTPKSNLNKSLTRISPTQQLVWTNVVQVLTSKRTYVPSIIYFMTSKYSLLGKVLNFFLKVLQNLSIMVQFIFLNSWQLSSIRFKVVKVDTISNIVTI
jgi:hypothetical protein